MTTLGSAVDRPVVDDCSRPQADMARIFGHQPLAAGAVSIIPAQISDTGG